MLLTKFSNLPIDHTAATNLTVAEIFLKLQIKICQLGHKTLPPHTDFIQLTPNISLKQIHYYVKHEDVLPIQKNVSHPILVEYGNDQFSRRILE